MPDALEQIQQRIISCRQCPRLVSWREEAAAVKVRRFRDESYWGKPLPGFGDPKARLVVVGLAPAAHGGNRTGRMFTGDDSADWLVRALYESGFSNQPTSLRAGDGLILYDAYMTAAVRCAPPQNKPTAEEARTCFHYLAEELDTLQPAVILALGRFAHDAVKKYFQGHALSIKEMTFSHGAQSSCEYLYPHRLTVLASYHPSRQNTQTHKLTREMFSGVFQTARTLLDG